MQNSILSSLSVVTRFIIFSTGMIMATVSHASDMAREQRLADEITEAILDGEAVYLKADEHKFLSIYTAAEVKPERGAAIILHGRGMHPDWGQVTGPLRVELPTRGWSTLALQMPVLDKEASYYDYESIFPEAIPRLEAAIRFLRSQGSSQIVLIAHSCGVHMSMAWIKQQGTHDIDAYIGIGMGATDYQQPMREPFPYSKIQTPLLNVIGSDDYPAVQQQAETIESLLDDLPAGSAQLRIEGAGHYFDDKNEALQQAIINWLDKMLPQQQ